MFERFTRDARAVVISTQDLCHGLGADEVRPVHLLLALTEEGSGVRGLLAAHGITTDAVATSLGIDLDAIRAAVERQFGQGALDEPPQDETQDAGHATRPGEDEDDDPWAARRRFGRSGHIRFGRGSKKVLELSLREAIRTGAREIRTEHIALGVLRADDEAVTMLLRTLGADPRVVRADLEDRGRRTA